jgi:hypothetical protein
MVEPIVEQKDKLTLEELKAIPQNERGRFIESSVYSLILANGMRGLTLSEIERVTQYPKNTLYKHVDLLFAKRKINRISVGNAGIFYPNGQVNRGVPPKDIMYGQGRRYGVRLLENLDGQYIHIQEREMNEHGFTEDLGGVLIPMKIIFELINMINLVIHEGEIEIKNRKVPG